MENGRIFCLFQDLHTVDLEEFKYGGTNITAFRLVDPDRADVIKVMRDWAYGSDSRFGRKQDGASSLPRVFNRPPSMSGCLSSSCSLRLLIELDEIVIKIAPLFRVY